MSFKENLLKKISIQRLSRKVMESMGPPDSGRKIDKEAMRELLSMSTFRLKKERDLDLYLKEAGDLPTDIVVLDNELGLYHTTPTDVALRKSPTVKEMVSIRNAIKILNDKDVLICKKQATVEHLQKELIDGLDLAFSPADIESIVKDGMDSLDNHYSEGVVECLMLLAEVLDYQPAPKAFAIRHHTLLGAMGHTSGGEALFGPMVIYSHIQNTLRLIDRKIGAYAKAEIEQLRQEITSDSPPALAGADVLRYLKDQVLQPNIGSNPSHKRPLD
jgi:hypothetical protein